MNEELLYFLWQNRLYRHHDLCTTDAEPLLVEHPGIRNRDSGPDFTQSRLRIGATRWAGNVEIHVKSSDWQKHGHANDPAFRGIILHVVFDDDLPGVCDAPVLELKKFIDLSLLEQYQQLMGNPEPVPCTPLLPNIGRETILFWMERLAIERLEERCRKLELFRRVHAGDWEETFFEWLAHAFGFHVNALPMELLARSLPLTMLARYKGKPEAFQAFFFGQAGFLQGRYKDGYHQSLAEEYRYLRKKHDLEPLEAHLWKYMRLRPGNFPGLRISQLATLMAETLPLLHRFLDQDDWRMFPDYLQCSGHEYWKHHVRFGEPGQYSSVSMGEESIHLLLVNAVAPFLFYYGRETNSPQNQEKALDMMASLPAEKNRIIRMWQLKGIKAHHISESQALIHLYNQYCLPRKCLDCRIGLACLKKGNKQSDKVFVV